MKILKRLVAAALCALTFSGSFAFPTTNLGARQTQRDNVIVEWAMPTRHKAAERAARQQLQWRADERCVDKVAQLDKLCHDDDDDGGGGNYRHMLLKWSFRRRVCDPVGCIQAEEDHNKQHDDEQEEDTTALEAAVRAEALQVLGDGKMQMFESYLIMKRRMYESDTKRGESVLESATTDGDFFTMKAVLEEAGYKGLAGEAFAAAREKLEIHNIEQALREGTRLAQDSGNTGALEDALNDAKDVTLANGLVMESRHAMVEAKATNKASTAVTSLKDCRDNLLLMKEVVGSEGAKAQRTQTRAKELFAEAMTKAEKADNERREQGVLLQRAKVAEASVLETNAALQLELAKAKEEIAQLHSEKEQLLTTTEKPNAAVLVEAVDFETEEVGTAGAYEPPHQEQDSMLKTIVTAYETNLSAETRRMLDELNVAANVSGVKGFLSGVWVFAEPVAWSFVRRLMERYGILDGDIDGPVSWTPRSSPTSPTADSCSSSGCELLFNGGLFASGSPLSHSEDHYGGADDGECSHDDGVLNSLQQWLRLGLVAMTVILDMVSVIYVLAWILPTFGNMLVLTGTPMIVVGEALIKCGRTMWDRWLTFLCEIPIKLVIMCWNVVLKLFTLCNASMRVVTRRPARVPPPAIREDTVEPINAGEEADRTSDQGGGDDTEIEEVEQEAVETEGTVEPINAGEEADRTSDQGGGDNTENEEVEQKAVETEDTVGPIKAGEEADRTSGQGGGDDTENEEVEQKAVETGADGEEAAREGLPTAKGAANEKDVEKGGKGGVKEEAPRL